MQNCYFISSICLLLDKSLQIRVILFLENYIWREYRQHSVLYWYFRISNIKEEFDSKKSSIKECNRDRQNVQKTNFNFANKIVVIIANIIIEIEKMLTNILFRLIYKFNIYNYCIV